MGMPKRIFISHSSKDKAFVEQQLVPLLNRHSINTWYSRDDIQSASDWQSSILDSLQECDWFLVVMSPSAMASEWVKAEVLWAFENRSGCIVPVLLEECQLLNFHLQMPRLQYVDFTAEVQTARQELLRIWGVKELVSELTQILHAGSMRKIHGWFMKNSDIALKAIGLGEPHYQTVLHIREGRIRADFACLGRSSGATLVTFGLLGKPKWSSTPCKTLSWEIKRLQETVHQLQARGFDLWDFPAVRELGLYDNEVEKGRLDSRKVLVNRPCDGILISGRSKDYGPRENDLRAKAEFGQSGDRLRVASYDRILRFLEQEI